MFYVLEIQHYENGERGHIVHWANDYLHGMSKFYEVLSAAAVSELPKHAAILVDDEGQPQDFKCFVHNNDTQADAEVGNEEGGNEEAGNEEVGNEDVESDPVE